MITWMQRHKKWLIITIWISTIAFVGAGFVGWGQYSYGDKAGAAAKVGNVEISMGELQKSYSNLYMQYNQMFQGNFDEEKAKQFGLQKQALNQLIQQALIINLANSYDLSISDSELIEALQQQEYFFKDGLFDKETYKSVLSQNRLTTKEYEADLKKNLLIMKTLAMLPVEATENEKNILNTLTSIADKINYKVLTNDDVTIDTSDEKLKAFWETKRQNFMSEVSYDIKYITQQALNNEYSEAELSKYYEANKTHFKDAEGKILSLEDAKVAITKELNDDATKDKALRAYIDYKKGNLTEDVAVQSTTISQSNNPFSAELFKKVTELSSASPYLKPVSVNGVYYIVELVKTNPSEMKSFEEAKAEVFPLFVQQERAKQLLALANESLGKFSGKTTDFVTVEDTDKITLLTQTEAKEFLGKLFTSDKKRSFIQLSNTKVVLFDVLEQKLLPNTNTAQSEDIVRFKSAMFNEALIKELQNKYQTEIFIQGL
ncbi:MAG: SurA N-terminal domain-containing protein [Campylobacterales bacterium]|nr:SurA N-terminal domain-containing protein [Campylobacterales bacterium]